MGQTEQLIIMYGLQMYFALKDTTNETVDQPIDFKGRFGFDLPFPITGTDILATAASFTPAVQYNLTNLYIGYNASKDKVYAVMTALPFFLLYVCLILAALYSQFWTEYCAIFLFGFGNWLTHATGYLNLMSSSQSRYSPAFVDPLIFCLILYADYNNLLPTAQLAMAYIILIVFRAICYLVFMRSMINQICDYCNIPFIRVKQDMVPMKMEYKKAN